MKLPLWVIGLMFFCIIIAFLLAYTKLYKLVFCIAPFVIAVGTIGYIRFIRDFFKESEDKD